MTAILLLNGTPPPLPRLRELSALHPVYAADGGAHACLRAGIRPHLVVGDFDSHPLADLPPDWTALHIPDPDSTDFEKLLRHLPAEITDLQILGAFGDRLDHLLTNLLVVTFAPPHLRIRLEGEGQCLTRVTPAHPYQALLPQASTLSLLPLAPVHGVRTSGLRWNLHNASMGGGGQLGQSNEVTGPVSIQVGCGSLLAWTPLHTPSEPLT